MLPCLICHGEKISSPSFSVFFPSSLLSLGLRGGDKSLLFSVAKRTTGGFSRIYRPGGRGDERGEKDRRGGRGNETRGDRGEMCRVGKKGER